MVELATRAGMPPGFRCCWSSSRPLQAVFGRCRWLSSPPGRAAPPGFHVQAVFGRCRLLSARSVQAVFGRCCLLRLRRLQAVFGRCCSWTSSRPLQAVFGRCGWLSSPPGRGRSAEISLAGRFRTLLLVALATYAGRFWTLLLVELATTAGRFRTLRMVELATRAGCAAGISRAGRFRTLLLVERALCAGRFRTLLLVGPRGLRRRWAPPHVWGRSAGGIVAGHRGSNVDPSKRHCRRRWHCGALLV
jgi:hypothetical protein